MKFKKNYGQGERVVKQKADKREQGEGGGLKTGKDVRTTFMDDHKRKRTL